jgi:hypothetical protein
MGLPDQDSSFHTDASVEAPNPLAIPFGSNELLVPLMQDARAPFNGVMLNGPAVARVAVEFRSQQRLCLIERNHDLGLVVARYNADISTLQLALDTQRRTDQVVLNARNNDIERLNGLIDRQTDTNAGPHVGEGLIWAGSGLLVGVLLVGGIVIFANAK